MEQGQESLDAVKEKSHFLMSHEHLLKAKLASPTTEPQYIFDTNPIARHFTIWKKGSIKASMLRLE
jgi:hypothetical protein